MNTITALLLTTLISAMQLPPVSETAPVAMNHFPTPVHAFVWRNWQLVEIDQMAQTVGAKPEDIVRMGQAMGLGTPPEISPEIRKRAYITIIRRNWHILPYDQMMKLLNMSEEELAFTLREDDFLYIKLGSKKPKCAPVNYTEPSDAILEAEKALAKQVKQAFPKGPATMSEPLFQFVADLSTPDTNLPPAPTSNFSPRYCSSYFALFGDPLLEDEIDPYPDAYLAKLASSGVDGIWMHVVLYQLAEFPWDPSMSEHYEARLKRLNELVERARKHGVGIFLYMNEPRAMPNDFFIEHENLKGVTIGDHSTLCTNAPEVAEYITSSIETICNAVPNLRGFFTITASENPTNCWSHNRGSECPRCSKIGPAKTVAGVNALIQAGIQRTKNKTELIAWDWGWRDDWALDAIAALPKEVAQMSVSEWSIPIERGGVKTQIGEYSISTIGPGPRATKHWKAARERGLKTVAKIQAGNTWEIAAVPYIPAVANVAQHAANLREAQLDGIMLGWSLGGYPSPNLQVVAEMSAKQAEGAAPPTPDEAMLKVATDRYGADHAESVVAAWKACSVALSEFPFHGSVVYRAPMQVGPANPLYSSATNYASSMVGIPYDDFKGWRGIYPEEVFIGQFVKMADGFAAAHRVLRDTIGNSPSPALQGELDVMETVAIHYQSIVQQCRFVQLREQLKANPKGDGAEQSINELEFLIRAERVLALRLHAIQSRDSRMGYESSNHYFYVPMDLAEKVINCNDLLSDWIPSLRVTL